MSAIAMLVMLLVAGQVRAADRYENAGNPPASGDAAATGATNGGAPTSSSPATNSGAANTASNVTSGAGGPGGGTDLQPMVGGEGVQNRSEAKTQAGGGLGGVNPFTPPTAAGTDRGGISPPPGTEQSPYRERAAAVQPPSGTGGTGGSAAPTGARPKPSAVMKKIMTAPPGSQLTGTPVRLTEVVASARSRHEQSHIVEAYWDLCSSVADYYLGVQEQGELRRLSSVNPRSGPLLQQAGAKFAVRLGTSKQAAVSSQRRLASMMGRAGGLPLPADLPHCGNYQTLYDQVFANRPSVEAEELAALLPLRYAELKDWAAAVVQTSESLNAIGSNDAGDGTETLRVLELLALQRRAFVQIARDYNRRIARYAELSTTGAINAEQLVDMLIKRDTTPTATRPTLPTGTNGRQSRSSVTPPPTFVADEGWKSFDDTQSAIRDDAVEPASGEEANKPREERSLLVAP